MERFITTVGLCGHVRSDMKIRWRKKVLCRRLHPCHNRPAETGETAKPPPLVLQDEGQANFLETPEIVMSPE